MTGQDVERELLLIAEKLRSKTSDAMSKVDARQKTAIKAYKISLSMIEQSQKMVNMSFLNRHMAKSITACVKTEFSETLGKCIFPSIRLGMIMKATSTAKKRFWYTRTPFR